VLNYTVASLCLYWGLKHYRRALSVAAEWTDRSLDQ
jgi:hypothetical protein